MHSDPAQSSPGSGPRAGGALLFELPQQDQPLESGLNHNGCRDLQLIPEPAPPPDFHSLHRHQYLSQDLTDGHQRVGLRTKLISICRAASIPVPEQTASAGDKSRPREEAPLRLPAAFGWRLLCPLVTSGHLWSPLTILEHDTRPALTSQDSVPPICPMAQAGHRY